jgi:hypothetical protein
MKRNPHKWSEVIKAWADGYPIQFRYFSQCLEKWSDWMDFPEEFEPINWGNPSTEFRIKPEGE